MFETDARILQNFLLAGEDIIPDIVKVERPNNNIVSPAYCISFADFVKKYHIGSALEELETLATEYREKLGIPASGEWATDGESELAVPTVTEEVSGEDFSISTTDDNEETYIAEEVWTLNNNENVREFTSKPSESIGADEQFNEEPESVAQFAEESLLDSVSKGEPMYAAEEPATEQVSIEEDIAEEIEVFGATKEEIDAMIINAVESHLFTSALSEKERQEHNKAENAANREVQLEIASTKAGAYVAVAENLGYVGRRFADNQERSIAVKEKMVGWVGAGAIAWLLAPTLQTLIEKLF